MSTVRPFAERGFTLIEFALVVLVISFAFSLVFPRIASLFTAGSVRGDSLRLTEAIRKARRYSVLSSLTLRLSVQLREGAWRAESLHADGSWGPLLDLPLLEGALSPGNRFRSARFTARRESPAEQIILHFYPSGDAEEVYLTLAGGDGEERTIHVHPALNRTGIAHGRLENRLR